MYNAKFFRSIIILNNGKELEIKKKTNCFMWEGMRVTALAICCICLLSACDNSSDKATTSTSEKGSEQNIINNAVNELNNRYEKVTLQLQNIDSSIQLSLKNDQIYEAKLNDINAKINTKNNSNNNPDHFNPQVKQALDKANQDIQVLKVKIDALCNTLQKQHNITEDVQKIASNTSGIPQNIEALQKQINELSSLQDRRKDAEKAFALAKQASSNGNTDQAMIYAMNAINHDSKNVSYLKYYAVLLQNIDSVDAIDQFISVLDLSVYQISAEHITTVIGIKQELLNKRESLISKLSQKKEQETQTQLKKYLQQLDDDFAINRIISDDTINSALLDQRIELLNKLLSDYQLDDSQRENLKKQQQYSVGLYSINSLFNTTKDSLEKARTTADSMKKTESMIDYRIASMHLQTASSSIAQFWSITKKDYNDFEKKARAYQQDILDLSEEISEIASLPAKRKIDKILQECNDIYDKHVTKEDGLTRPERIKKIQKVVRPIDILMTEIYSLKIQKNIMERRYGLRERLENMPR